MRNKSYFVITSVPSCFSPKSDGAKVNSFSAAQSVVKSVILHAHFNIFTRQVKFHIGQFDMVDITQAHILTVDERKTNNKHHKHQKKKITDKATQHKQQSSSIRLCFFSWVSKNCFAFRKTMKCCNLAESFWFFNEKKKTLKFYMINVAVQNVLLFCLKI